MGPDAHADALAICLDVCGEVRLAGIARLLGITDDRAREELGTLVFDDPEAGPLVPAAEYLSGKVRDKLTIAPQAAAHGHRVAGNAAELLKMIPAHLPPAHIHA